MHFVRERDALKTEVERLSATVTDIGRREGHLKDELDKVTKDVSSLLLPITLLQVSLCLWGVALLRKAIGGTSKS